MSNHERRSFLKRVGTRLVALGASPALIANTSDTNNRTQAERKKKKPAKRYTEGLVLSTWDAGLLANAAAWKAMEAGGKAIDMAEKGVNDTEAGLRN